MKATYHRCYVSDVLILPIGIVCIYTVTGTKKKLQEFKKAQAQYYRETEDGTPVFYKRFGPTIKDCPRSFGVLKLKIKKGNVISNN